jgi:hypothetical protein
MRYESLNAETPEAWLVIDRVLTAFVNILKFRRVSSRVNGDDDEDDWMQNHGVCGRNACQQPHGRELF